jgi:hypothetical protein
MQRKMQAWLLPLPVQHSDQHEVHPSCEHVHSVSALTAWMASKPRMRHLLHALHCTLHGQRESVSWLCCTRQPAFDTRVQQVCSGFAAALQDTHSLTSGRCHAALHAAAALPAARRKHRCAATWHPLACWSRRQRQMPRRSAGTTICTQVGRFCNMI